MENLKHRTLARGIAILETVAEARDGMTITDLAHISGIEKSTTSRLVSSLCDFGYLTRLPDRRVVLTGRVLRLTHGFQEQFNLQKVARPALIELRDKVGEAIVLTVREGNFSVSIDQVDPEQNFRMVPHIGNYAPLEATAAGRAMLFALPAPEQHRILEATQHEPLEHPEVRLDAETLVREGEVARRRGYVWIKRSDDVERVAAVVLDSLGAPLAAVSIYGPRYRMQDKLDELGKECRLTADSVGMLARGQRARKPW